ncbi:MAG: protein translocase subunit SecF [Clostridia bacterium]|nr:protein translocase subunit SecF [Clostridia bacterium]
MNIDFVGKRKWFYIFSSALILISVVSFFTKGFQQDIEFSGGTVIDINLPVAVNNNDVEALVRQYAPNSEPRIQKSDKIDENGRIVSSGVSISCNALEEEQKNNIITAIGEKYEVENIEELATFRTVKPTFGTEMKNRAIKATVLAVIAIIIYIALAFRKVGGISAGVTATLALCHDLIIMIAVYSLCGLPLNTTFVAALLTILGYSVNDTVVIYDRIRENKNLHRKMEDKELINLSINQSLRRTIFTSISVTVALAIIFGFSTYFKVTTMQRFALPLLVGMVIGTYTSICLASNLWYDWRRISDQNAKNKRVAKKA